ncbi:MAG: UvrD-helicase domain-containing protein [Candidatus Pacebacteria bacterium]|nr:UvrD-helicase domain-containing protein [Candidatus Paceibacterota bacterium]
MDSKLHLKGLNPEQLKAASHSQGPLLILAGAGAGKTKTLTHRILNLIHQGIRPSQILAITFTNKAAKEMRERVERLLETDPALNMPISGASLIGEKPFVSTFHSLGVHILKENASKIGLTRHFSIYDRADSKRAVKEALEKVGIDPKQYEPAKILSVISREKGDFVSQSEYEAKKQGDYFGEIVAKVWREYDAIVAKEKALDFDDLLFKTARLLEKDKAVREHYQSVWQYIHVDEYQDTNTVQYTIVKLLSQKSKNLAVVGDTDQCLLPSTKISTPTGYKKISDLKSKGEVISASGGGETCSVKIKRVKKKKFKGEVIEIKTKSGKTLSLTPNHIIFSKLSLNPNIFYVYLMYKKSMGFRIGITKGARNARQKTQTGLIVRCNQEHADRMWILKVCENLQETHYWEYYFSTHYGIPLIAFHGIGRNMILTQNQIDILFKKIDTRERVKKVFEDLGLVFDFPHHFPQGTIGSNGLHDRINIRLTMFSDGRKSNLHPWGLSRVSINTNNKVLKEKILTMGLNVRKGKKNDWRLEMARLDYAEAEKLATAITSKVDNVTLIKSALITKGERWFFQPASHLNTAMKVAICENEKIKEDDIVSVEKKYYDGPVYDLDIENVHNYIAGDIAVHNCIYGWRGADIKNILRFEEDYPDATIVLLEENYRSTQTILSVANDVIKKNIHRREKNLFTKNPTGEPLGLYCGFDEADEANFVANTARKLIENGVLPEEIAVLYRANFQSRALEDAFLSKNIPYQMLGTRFFERKEIKDALSYLRLALNEDSLSDIKRIINVPVRGIGKVTILKIFEGNEHQLPQATREKIHNFRLMLQRIRENIFKERPSVVVKKMLAESGLENMYRHGKEEDQEKLENLRELATLALKYDHMTDGLGIEELLKDAALQSDQDNLEVPTSAVKLMTVHSSKGLEFDYVFITGLEAGLFPHERAGSRSDQGSAPVRAEDEEEERRLFYVALTRARKKIYLSYANARTIFGSRQVTMPSEFIADVDEAYLEPQEKATGAKLIFIDF